jgi:hypothetical protein
MGIAAQDRVGTVERHDPIAEVLTRSNHRPCHPWRHHAVDVSDVILPTIEYPGESPYQRFFPFEEGLAESRGNDGALIATLGWSAVYSMSSLQSHQRIEDIWASSSKMVYLVMSNHDCQHLVGSRATAHPSTVPLLKGIWGTSDGDIWSVGSHGGISRHHAPIQHFAGREWFSTFKTDYSCAKASFNGLWGISASDIWATGRLLCHYDGDSWTSAPLPSGTPTQYGIWGTSANNVWSVGWEGSILHYNGTTWAAVSAPAGTSHLYGIHGTSSGNIWAVGAEGTILHFDGSAWKRIQTDSNDHLHDVWARSTEDAWAVGSRGTLLHFTRHPPR